MGLIENSKVYSGSELENIIFRPVLTGPSAEKLGIRILYNMPLPTTVHLWEPSIEVLKPYKAGWQGENGNKKRSKTIDMQKVKAESSFSASDYFSMVFEEITNSAQVNMQDLNGTILEEAETALFKKSVAESLRLTMWLGNTDGSRYNTFNGILKSVFGAVKGGHFEGGVYQIPDEVDASNVVEVLDKVWKSSHGVLRTLKSEGELVYYVTSDIYEAYEHYLDAKGVDSAYRESADGRETLSYHGIPLVDAGLTPFVVPMGFPPVFCILTDRRNLVLAVNTADNPDAEVRMWYNPDEMENRQRAVFLAGADFIDERLLSVGYMD